MHEEIIQMLRKNNGYRDWDTMLQEFKSNEFELTIAKYINNKPVYEFFNTYSDNLVLNSSSITISVQPINSFIPFHIHDYVEINIPLVGNCVVVTEHERIEVNQDDMIFVGIKTPHKVEMIDQNGVVLNIELRT